MVLALVELRGLRTAPALTPEQRQALLAELRGQLERCDWFTIGMMAASGPAALAALRAAEAALGWQALELDPASARPNDVGGPAFLKGNQNTGRFQVRPEPGLGEGLLITGHSPAEPAAEDTWGPLPLDVFGP
ncbi:MAG: DUF1824 family protein [Cyanobacteriota bacterium]